MAVDGLHYMDLNTLSLKLERANSQLQSEDIQSIVQPIYSDVNMCVCEKEWQPSSNTFQHLPPALTPSSKVSYPSHTASFPVQLLSIISGDMNDMNRRTIQICEFGFTTSKVN